MEAEHEHDALTGEPVDPDPFADVPADGGGEPDPELVQPGELGGYNPSELEQEELAAQEPDPLAEPDPADVLADPEAEAEAEEDEPEPVSEEELAEDAAAEAAETPEEGGIPDDSVGSEPEPEAPAPEPTPPAAEPEAEKPKAKPKRSRNRRPAPPKKGERDYIVLRLGGDGQPVAIAGEVRARTEREARRGVFGQIEEEAALMVALPARYWKPVPMEKTMRQVPDIKEG